MNREGVCNIKVLVANRGEIACRILRACIEAGHPTVAVYAGNDADSMFVEMADEAVLLMGDTIGETYLDQRQIIEAARSTGATAIHPGFGFLSERADFATAVLEAGLTWVGPSPQAIEKMGDKMTARQTMREAGVPVIPVKKSKKRMRRQLWKRFAKPQTRWLPTFTQSLEWWGRQRYASRSRPCRF